MAQEQNYTVSYKIDVEATQGTRQVQDFDSEKRHYPCTYEHQEHDV